MPPDTSIFSIVKDSVIAIAAFIGMGLGIYNLWSERQKDKIKLEIIPKSIMKKGRSNSGKEFVITTSNEFIFNEKLPQYAFEIINHSKFDVIVSEVGLLNSKTDGRYYIPEPIIHDNGDWPRRLEPRASVTLYADLPSILNIEHLQFVTSAFVSTSCNHVTTGTSNSLMELVQHARKFA